MSLVEPHPFPHSAQPLLEVRDLSFGYAGRLVLEHVSLSIGSGEFVALTGANGSGKSTLIKIALGLLRAPSGRVELLGGDPGHLHEPWRLGYVPQRPRLDLDLPASVEEIVTTGRLPNGRWWRRLRAEDNEAVDHALKIAGLDELRTSRMSALSGGQQQRTFIARALASMPQLLVLDEPTTGVDADSLTRFREALVHHVRVHGGTVLLVTHELEPVAADLDRILVMKDGRIV